MTTIQQQVDPDRDPPWDPAVVLQLATEQYAVTVDVTVTSGKGDPLEAVILTSGIVAVMKVEGQIDPQTGLLVGRPREEIIREVIAYDVSVALGWGDLVPPTAFRVDGEVLYSFQLYVGGATPGGPLIDATESQLARAAALDEILDQRDRKADNWLIVEHQGSKRLVLVDNGFSLGFPPDLAPARVIQDNYGYLRGKIDWHVPPEELPAVLTKALDGVLPDADVAGVIQRAQKVASFAVGA